MVDGDMRARISEGDGFIAALDQSGGSTPGALRLYGVPDSAYDGETAMFKLIHEMRVRIMRAPAFTGKVIGAILFERTMDGTVGSVPVPTYLWKERRVVPFIKIDLGLEAARDGVRVMKPIPTLDTLLARAVKLGVFGTKMRSVIDAPSKDGIDAIVAQQFDLAARIAGHGLVPIIEPEISITIPDKAGAETLLLEALLRKLDTLPADRQVMLKLTLPDRSGFYAPLVHHSRVLRVVALSGGYARTEACERLAANPGVIASFSRALLEDLRYSMTDALFESTLAQAIDEIYRASTVKVPPR